MLTLGEFLLLLEEQNSKVVMAPAIVALNSNLGDWNVKFSEDE